MWSGSISFGLVNVPVKLYPAVREQTVHFHMLSKDGGCRLRRKLYCPDTGEEVITHVPEEEEAPRILSLQKALEQSLKEAKKAEAPRRRRRKSA